MKNGCLSLGFQYIFLSVGTMYQLSFVEGILYCPGSFEHGVQLMFTKILLLANRH